MRLVGSDLIYLFRIGSDRIDFFNFGLDRIWIDFSTLDRIGFGLITWTNHRIQRGQSDPTHISNYHFCIAHSYCAYSKQFIAWCMKSNWNVKSKESLRKKRKHYALIRHASTLNLLKLTKLLVWFLCNSYVKPIWTHVTCLTLVSLYKKVFYFFKIFYFCSTRLTCHFRKEEKFISTTCSIFNFACMLPKRTYLRRWKRHVFTKLSQCTPMVFDSLKYHFPPLI